MKKVRKQLEVAMQRLEGTKKQRERLSTECVAVVAKQKIMRRKLEKILAANDESRASSSVGKED